MPHPHAKVAQQKGQPIALYSASVAGKFIEVVHANGSSERLDVINKREARQRAASVNALPWNF